MTREQFINATMNRLAQTDVESTMIHDLERVGKKLEMDTLVVEIVNTVCSRNSYIKSEGSLDITGAEGVQVQIKDDGKVLWVNTENGCVLRICQIKHIEVNDGRVKHG
jgi:hypothetical protein